jgi:hypothetical protein
MSSLNGDAIQHGCNFPFGNTKMEPNGK